MKNQKTERLKYIKIYKINEFIARSYNVLTFFSTFCTYDCRKTDTKLRGLWVYNFTLLSEESAHVNYNTEIKMYNTSLTYPFRLLLYGARQLNARSPNKDFDTDAVQPEDRPGFHAQHILCGVWLTGESLQGFEVCFYGFLMTPLSALQDCWCLASLIK